MRSAAARAGVASTIAYGDSERKLREIRRVEQDEAIWSEPPFAGVRTLGPDEVCFRIKSPRGFSLWYDMEPAVLAMSGQIIKAPVRKEIAFVPSVTEYFGEFVTSDKRAIARLREPDMVARGIVEYNSLHEERMREEGEKLAQKLKAEPHLMEGLVEGLKSLGVRASAGFLDALRPQGKPPEAEEQQKAPAPKEKAS